MMSGEIYYDNVNPLPRKLMQPRTIEQHYRPLDNN